MEGILTLWRPSVLSVISSSSMPDLARCLDGPQPSVPRSIIWTSAHQIQQKHRLPSSPAAAAAWSINQILRPLQNTPQTAGRRRLLSLPLQYPDDVRHAAESDSPTAYQTVPTALHQGMTNWVVDKASNVAPHPQMPSIYDPMLPCRSSCGGIQQAQPLSHRHHYMKEVLHILAHLPPESPGGRHLSNPGASKREAAGKLHSSLSEGALEDVLPRPWGSF